MLSGFRRGFYDCPTGRADALFGLPNAIGCGGSPVTDLARIVLAMAHSMVSGATQRVRDLVTEGVQVQNLGICETELFLLRRRNRAGEEMPVVAVSALGLDPWSELDNAGVADVPGIGSAVPRDDPFSDAP